MLRELHDMIRRDAQTRGREAAAARAAAREESGKQTEENAGSGEQQRAAGPGEIRPSSSVSRQTPRLGGEFPVLNILLVLFFASRLVAPRIIE